MLRPVDSITFNRGFDNKYTVIEHVYERAAQAHLSISETGQRSRFYDTGNTPWFLNGEESTRAKVLEEIKKHKAKKRTVIRVTGCTDEGEGFEIAISVRIFSTRAAFERSPYCRRFTYFLDFQKEQHKFLSK